MSATGFSIEVTNLSPRATENDVYEFFSFSGPIEHVEIIRSGDAAATAYVTFREKHAFETAVLLSGATIVDQCVCIREWGDHVQTDDWSKALWKFEDSTNYSTSQADQFVSSPGEAVTLAQEVVKTMLVKGYVLGKDAFSKAKAFDESHGVSTSAMAKVCDLSKKIGLTDKINHGVDTVKYVNDTYHVCEITKAIASATGKSAVSTAQYVVNSSYFSAGAMWVSDALSRASKAASDLASHGNKK